MLARMPSKTTHARAVLKRARVLSIVFIRRWPPNRPICSGGASRSPQPPRRRPLSTATLVPSSGLPACKRRVICIKRSGARRGGLLLRPVPQCPPETAAPGLLAIAGGRATHFPKNCGWLNGMGWPKQYQHESSLPVIVVPGIHFTRPTVTTLRRRGRYSRACVV